MKYEELKRLATDAEILFAIKDRYDCDYTNLVKAYLMIRELDDKFKSLCERLEVIRIRNREYNKVLKDIVETFKEAGLRQNIEITEY